ncbi:hypothetical protein ASG89_11040 [Paenibacillus sp. Soil766]|nr:hypothetical protein ASG89_11040 [Paenibacillus sp. Soil766]
MIQAPSLKLFPVQYFGKICFHLSFILLEKVIGGNLILYSLDFAIFLQRMDARVVEILYYKEREVGERRGLF